MYGHARDIIAELLAPPCMRPAADRAIESLLAAQRFAQLIARACASTTRNEPRRVRGRGQPRREV